MRKIKFEKRRDSVLNTIFIKLQYMSGDADAYEYEQVPLKDITFTNYEEHLPRIEKIVEQYQLIGKFTDCNDKLCLSHPKWSKIKTDDPYEYIKENYSEELAELYENVPGDSTCDFQFKAHLRNITLCGYNDKGEYFESYI